MTRAEIRQLHHTVGTENARRILSRNRGGAGSRNLAIQTKLTVGPAHDRFEVEADRIAGQVMRQINRPAPLPSVPLTPAPPTPAPPAPIHSVLSRAHAPAPIGLEARTNIPEFGEQLGHEFVQRALQFEGGIGAEGGDVNKSVESSIRRARGGGQPLGKEIRGRMENAFKADFSSVRIHHNTESDKLNRQLNAKAFTTGKDIFFRRGQYNPGSSGGQKLLAHELTHVVQQSGGEVQRDFAARQPVIQREILFGSDWPSGGESDLGEETSEQQQQRPQNSQGRSGGGWLALWWISHERQKIEQCVCAR